MHTFVNFMVLAGAEAEVRSLHQFLARAQTLQWRAAEDVEREVALLALKASGRRLENLELEDLLGACEVVESRHLIDNGTIARHFRNMWSASSAYCRAYVRGLVAHNPGEVGGGAARAAATGMVLREGFSLTRMVLPPYRILQGSYRYAGRSWCSATWGTPEDARLIASQFKAEDRGRASSFFEYETVDGAPVGALRRLLERHLTLALACISVDSDNGIRMLSCGGRGGSIEVSELEQLAHDGGALNAAQRQENRQLAVERALSLLG